MTGVVAASERSLPNRHGAQELERKGVDMISELPLDILREIFSRLHPTAVLRLAQTCKPFRKYLMNRTLARASVWIPALELVEDLPPCPEDISEPRYTYLMFYSRCDECRSIDTEKVVHIYLTHQMLCLDCIPKHFATIGNIPNVTDEKIGILVTEWTVPSISILEAERVHHKESAKKLVEEYKSLPPDDVDAVGDLQSRWEEWMESCVEHDRLCRSFLDHSIQAYRCLKEKRTKEIIKRMSELGFSQECETFFTDLEDMSRDQRARWKELDLTFDCLWSRRIDTDKLTDCEWKELDGIVIPYMEGERAYQVEQHRKEMMVHRMHTWFKPAFLRFIFSSPTNAGIATPGEFALTPEWRKALLSKPTEEDFSADDIAEAEAQMPASWEKIRRWKTEQLMNIVRKSKTYEGQDVREDVILLASTIFRCSKCQERYTYATAIIHRCNYDGKRLGVHCSEKGVVFEESTGSQTLTCRAAIGPERWISNFFEHYPTQSDVWDLDGKVTFDDEAHEHVVHMLDVLGRGRSTLATDIEREQPYVQLLCPCYEEEASHQDKPREEVGASRRAMKWTDAVNRARPHSAGETPHPWYAKLNDEDQTSAAKFERERHQSIHMPPLWSFGMGYYESSSRESYLRSLKRNRMEHPEGADATKAYVDSLPSFTKPCKTGSCVVALHSPSAGGETAAGSQ